MANPLYQMLMQPNATVQSMPTMPVAQPQQPMNRMHAFFQAMQNPAAFVKRAFPDIPDSIAHDPNQILGYLQQTRGISNSQIQQIMQMAGAFR